MELPKLKPHDNRPHRRIFHKYCKEPGCPNDFFGSYIQKYCDTHRDVLKRKRNKKPRRDPDADNLVIMHHYQESQAVVMECHLDGCGGKVEFTILPNQFIYPKFCKEHRNPFKRRFFAS